MYTHRTLIVVLLFFIIFSRDHCNTKVRVSPLRLSLPPCSDTNSMKPLIATFAIHSNELPLTTQISLSPVSPAVCNLCCEC